MTEYMTEEEQVQQLKKWLKENGLTIVTGVLAALIVVSGWHFWQYRHTKTLTHASGIYDEMLMLRTQNNTADTITQAKKLLSRYPSTPYATMAALMLAREAIVNKNFPEATQQLNWVIAHSNNPSLREIAKIRLARIAIANNKADDAFKILRQVDDASFNGLIEEVKGDAYVAMHDAAKAKTSYQLALQELPKEEATQRPVLQMKLDNLATASDAT